MGGYSNRSAVCFMVEMTSTPKGQRSMQVPHSTHSEAFAGRPS